MISITAGTIKTIGNILPGKQGAFVDHPDFEKIIIPYGSIFNDSGRLISIEMNVAADAPFEVELWHFRGTAKYQAYHRWTVTENGPKVVVSRS